MNRAQIDQIVSDFIREFKRWANRSVRVTDSADWYNQTFASCGSWDSWIWETVNGVDFQTRRRNFDGFVVLSDSLGRANAGIVRLALRNNAPVLAWKNDAIRTVTALEEIDVNDWMGGWQVQTAAMGA